MQRFFWTWSKWPSSLKLPYTGYFKSLNYAHLRISKGTLGLHIGIKIDFWKWRAVTRKSHHCKIFPFLRFFLCKLVENRYWIEYKPLWCSGEAVGLSPQWSWVRLPAPGNIFCGCCRSCLYIFLPCEAVFFIKGYWIVNYFSRIKSLLLKIFKGRR